MSFVKRTLFEVHCKNCELVLIDWNCESFDSAQLLVLELLAHHTFKASEMLEEVRSNKTVKYSNVHAVWSYLLGCQSILVQELSSSSLKALWHEVRQKKIKSPKMQNFGALKPGIRWSGPPRPPGFALDKLHSICSKCSGCSIECMFFMFHIFSTDQVLGSRNLFCTYSAHSTC